MIAATVRADSWAAPLTSAQMWELFDFHFDPHRAAGKWYVTLDYAEKEFKIPHRPGHEAFYKWLRSMRKIAPAHHREVREAADEIAAEGAKNLSINDEQIIAFVKSRALEAAALSNDKEEAGKFFDMADKLIRAGQKDAELKMRQRELDLKAAAQQTKDEQLKLAREKFEAAEKRLKAVQDAVSSAKSKGGLTAETLRQIEEAAGLL